MEKRRDTIEKFRKIASHPAVGDPDNVEFNPVGMEAIRDWLMLE